VKFTYDVEVTPAEIRQAWGSMMDGENPFSSKQKAPQFIASGFAAYRSATADPWVGATGAEINERLIHGYAVEASEHAIGEGMTEFSMSTMTLDDEEGDLLIDQVLGGEDLYRAQWSEQDAPRAITIRACITFAARAGAQVVNEYLTWLLKVVDAAQRRGLAATVELWMGIKGGYASRPSETTRIRIPLVDAGEMLDVTSWQAYLTPGAFRSLGFFGIVMAADKVNRTCVAGLGAPTNKRWNVTYEDGVLDVECPSSADTFPEEYMDELLAESGV
jgi:hypothetical protein